MTDPAMSPAQKITAAFKDRHELCGPFDDNWVELCLAAVFREAATELGYHIVYDDGEPDYRVDVPDLLAIAAELEGQPDG